MARRKSTTRRLMTTATAVAILGVGVLVYSWPGGGDAAPATPLPAENPTARAAGPVFAPPTTRPAPAPLAAVEKAAPKLNVAPATKPAALQAAPVTGQEASRPTVVLSGDAPAIFQQVDAKRKADDLIAARDLLVAALHQNKFTGAAEDEALRRLNEINGVVVFSPRKFLSDGHAVSHTVAPGENLQKIANKYDSTPGFIARINGISDPRKLRAGKSIKVIKGPFHAVVNKKEFTLDTYLGRPGTPEAIFIRRFRVGLGSEDSTPTGEWKVDTKLINPRYYNPREEGPRVIEPDDPKNPLGERWIALEGVAGQAVGKSSYGIHGTIEPESIGKQASLGCIRMLNEDVEIVYDMLITDKSFVIVE